VKLGIAPIEGARYQWLRAGVPLTWARIHQLVLTPFGPAKTGSYQLRVTLLSGQVQTFGPWVLTHEDRDPTVLVYALALKGTETNGASETPAVLGGFLLLDRKADRVVLITSRTTRVGKQTLKSYIVEERTDASILSNGPVPGVGAVKGSRTLVTGTLGINTAETPLWLEGDRDHLWLTGNDRLITLDKQNLAAAVVAPPVLSGFAGTLMTEPVQIDQLTVTGRLSVPHTRMAWMGNLQLDAVRDMLIEDLKSKGFTLQQNQ
jgi:hypothetical protein